MEGGEMHTGSWHRDITVSFKEGNEGHVGKSKCQYIPEIRNDVTLEDSSRKIGKVRIVGNNRKENSSIGRVCFPTNKDLRD
jgi:hypothetical protein